VSATTDFPSWNAVLICDRYTVEKIMGHEFTKDGKLMLQVKWHGYDDPADQTLEPEENLL
jgi:chromobox protein 1